VILSKRGPGFAGERYEAFERHSDRSPSMKMKSKRRNGCNQLLGGNEMGTGITEIEGLTTFQGVAIIRGTRGLDVVGGDLVEVAAPYDPSGNTAFVAANLLFGMLCVLPGVVHRE
jgi:Arginase family